MPLPDSSTIYYLRNSYTQQYLSLSGSGPAVAPAAKDASLGQQVSIESCACVPSTIDSQFLINSTVEVFP